MADETPDTAFLTKPGGEALEIGQSISIGRGPTNRIVLKDEEISRRHALIHREDDGCYWLVDFGSRNGVAVNGRKISGPTKLAHGDLLSVGPFSLTFLDPESEDDGNTDHFTKTRERVDLGNCWMLLADIAASTKMLHKLPATEWRRLVRRWLDDCRKIVETNKGHINTQLGDGLFAYWPEDADAPDNVNNALSALKRMQTQRDPEFRIALHYGEVLAGGGDGVLEAKLSGINVNFLFRMEKLGGQLKKSCIMSHPAQELLAEKRSNVPVGEFELNGFEGEYEFFAF